MAKSYNNLFFLMNINFFSFILIGRLLLFFCLMFNNVSKFKFERVVFRLCNFVDNGLRIFRSYDNFNIIVINNNLWHEILLLF